MYTVINFFIKATKLAFSKIGKNYKLDNAMIITYTKIERPKKTATGYDFDMEDLIKRYTSNAKNASITNLMRNDNAIKDNLYFMEIESAKYIKSISKNALFLDVGCGNGLYSKLLSRSGSLFKNVKYYGCEISQGIVDVCIKYNHNSIFFVSYAESINKPDKYFDFVLYSGIIHYSQNNWKKVLNEMSRVSKEYVFITRTPVTKYNNTFYVHQRVASIDGVENHYFVVLNRDEFEEEISKLGFEIVMRDYSSEEFNIKGVSEKIVLVQYLLKKIR